MVMAPKEFNTTSELTVEHSLDSKTYLIEVKDEGHVAGDAILRLQYPAKTNNSNVSVMAVCYIQL